jgi:hypothetical protein
MSQKNPAITMQKLLELNIDWTPERNALDQATVTGRQFVEAYVAAARRLGVEEKLHSIMDEYFEPENFTVSGDEKNH